MRSVTLFSFVLVLFAVVCQYGATAEMEARSLAQSDLQFVKENDLEDGGAARRVRRGASEEKFKRFCRKLKRKRKSNNRKRMVPLHRPGKHGKGRGRSAVRAYVYNCMRERHVQAQALCYRYQRFLCDKLFH